MRVRTHGGKRNFRKKIQTGKRIGKKKSGARRGVKAGAGKTGNGEEREAAIKRYGMPAGSGKVRAGREQNGEERMNAGRRTGRIGQKGRGREAGQER